jgi:S1-C subfamily serine protease
MLRALFLATLCLAASREASGQAVSVLHIKVVLIDADQKPMPVPHHALLISENPASAAPRRILTAADGTADVKLRPGNYTVESDRPVAFGGKAYQWTQTVDIAAGRDAALDLTSGNAEVGAVTAETTTAGPPLEADPSFLQPRWQASVVALWTPVAHASGFVIDARGLVATNQRVIGSATSVEVQLTPQVKVAGRVLVADRIRDVAILWIDPSVAASLPPVPLGCADAAKPAVVDGQELYTIGVPLRQEKGMSSGTVSRVDEHAIMSDLVIAPGSAGGPVFTAAGGVVGITSIGDDREDGRRADAWIVRVEDACLVLAAAETKMKATTPPDGAHLPVEPAKPFPLAALEAAAKGRTGSLSPYQISSSDFDIAFITPVLTYGEQYQLDQARRRERGRGARTPDTEPGGARPLMDFSNWSEYVADYPPVLLIRVTPKLVEGFWTTVARGAARTQGVSLPPIKRFKSGFSRLRAFCGDAEVAPVHPFKLEQRIAASDAIYEGLYVFDPGALGPQCGTVKLALYSEKEPEKADTRVVDPKVIDQIWQDFAAYRSLQP